MAMPDPFIADLLLRFLLLGAVAVLFVIVAAHLVSRAIDRLLSRRERAVHGSSGTVSSVPQFPAAAPAFDLRSLPSRYKVGSRLARDHLTTRNVLALHAQRMAREQQHEKEAVGP